MLLRSIGNPVVLPPSRRNEVQEFMSYLRLVKSTTSRETLPLGNFLKHASCRVLVVFITEGIDPDYDGTYPVAPFFTLSMSAFKNQLVDFMVAVPQLNCRELSLTDRLAALSGGDKTVSLVRGYLGVTLEITGNGSEINLVCSPHQPRSLVALETMRLEVIQGRWDLHKLWHRVQTTKGSFMHVNRNEFLDIQFYRASDPRATCTRKVVHSGNPPHVALEQIGRAHV